MWIARMYQAERANTCIISNGFAAMGIAVPGAIAAKLAYSDRKVVAVTGDAAFMMNSQEIETALRVGTPFVTLIWNDAEYGLITASTAPLRPAEPHRFQESRLCSIRRKLRRKGLSRRERSRSRIYSHAGAGRYTVAIVDCPVDYSENMKLTKKLQELVSPI